MLSAGAIPFNACTLTGGAEVCGPDGTAGWTCDSWGGVKLNGALGSEKCRAVSARCDVLRVPHGCQAVLADSAWKLLALAQLLAGVPSSCFVTEALEPGGICKVNVAEASSAAVTIVPA